jgi:peptidyl-prolyl cis-trans isomerase D
MLKIFRKKIVSKVILWGLLILILPAFVMWGSASMSRSKDKGPKNAGIINGKKISFEELYGAISGVRTQIILTYYNQPKVLELLLTNKPLIAKLAWDRLLLLSEAKRLGINAPDKDVISSIKTHPLFLKDGAFDDRFYAYMLSHNIGLEPRSFEEIVRENLKVQRLSSHLTKDLKVTDREAADEYKKEFVKLKISYILLEPKDVSDQVKLEKNAVKDFYDKHKSEMMIKTNSADPSSPKRMATLDESKETIEKYLKDTEIGKLLKAKSDEIYKSISDRVLFKKEAFEGAAAGLKLAAKNTDFFSKNDTVKDLSDVPVITDAGSGFKEGEIPRPLDISLGILIFQVKEKKAPDDEAFEKEKDEYLKKVRERRVDSFMEDYLKKMEEAAKPAVKFEDIEKYYR